jgi:ABC-2 type transport system permease protein
MKIKGKYNLYFQFLLGLIILILINIIGSYKFARVDLTSEKRYSLSHPTIKLVGSLEDMIYVKVYLKGDFPAGFKRLSNATREMLDEFRAYANGNMEYVFINPSENPNIKERNQGYAELVTQGLQPTSLEVAEEGGSSQKIIFPGAIMSYRERELPIQLLKTQLGAPPELTINNSIEGLEYELSNTIRKLIKKTASKIAFIEGHGELTALEVQDISNTLREYYLVERVTINEKLDALNGFRTAIIAKPSQAYSEKDKFIIDQFIMNGGRVLWFMDGVSTSMDSLVTAPVTMGIPLDNNLDDQLFKYGVRINKDLVQDVQSGLIPLNTSIVGSPPKWELFPWIYFPLIMPNVDHPIVSNLNAIKCEFVSSLDTVFANGINKTILLKTSNHARKVTAPVKISLELIKNLPDEELFTDPGTPLAVLLEGQFTSVFKNRIPANIANDSTIGFKPIGSNNKMIIVADGDMIRNHVQRSSGKTYPLGFDKYTGQEFGNKDFVLNCVDYISDDSDLITVRSRELKLRLLNKQKIQDERVKWQLVNTGLPVVVVGLMGLLIMFLRKRKYTN